MDKWIFTEEQMANTPSRINGICEEAELCIRQEATKFLQTMGQNIKVTQLCVLDAIVYMHRFYMHNSFTKIQWKKLTIAALFLATKNEDQPRKLEHLIKVAHACLHKDSQSLDVRSEEYRQLEREVLKCESDLLMTFGFRVIIEHPHTFVIDICQKIKAPKKVARTAYDYATVSIRKTTMCLTIKPSIVACACVHLAIKRFDFKIEQSANETEWFNSDENTLELEYLEKLSEKLKTAMETRLPYFQQQGCRLNGSSFQLHRDTESRKRVHSNSKDGKEYCDPSNSKYFKVDHVQKNHLGCILANNRPSKSLRLNKDIENSVNGCKYVTQKPSNGNKACSNFHAQYGLTVEIMNFLKPLPPQISPIKSPARPSPAE